MVERGRLRWGHELDAPGHRRDGGPRVSTAAEGPATRTSRRPTDRLAARRAELGASVLRTLGELGYARTSLREIAQNSEFSHGVLHYYFQDKIDLITSAVRLYKTECVTRYDDLVAAAGSAEDLRVAFGQAMASTMVEDELMHRLWYDLRNQSVFEPGLRADVRELDDGLCTMIWRVVQRHADLRGGEPGVTRTRAYAQFDGLFQHALFRHVADDPTAGDDLARDAADLLADLG